jgi:hypothetical protein
LGTVWFLTTLILRNSGIARRDNSINDSGTVEAEIRYFLSICRDDPLVDKKRTTLGAGRHLLEEQQPRPESDGSSQLGHPAQGRHQPHGAGPNKPDQHAGPSQAGRLE